MTDAMREAFEADTAEWSSNYGDKDEHGKYMDQSVQNAWMTWQRVWQSATEAARGGEKSGVWQYYWEGLWRVGSNKGNYRLNKEKQGIPTRDLYTHPPAPVVPEGWGVRRHRQGCVYLSRLADKRKVAFFDDLSSNDALIVEFLSLFAAPESDQQL